MREMRFREEDARALAEMDYRSDHRLQELVIVGAELIQYYSKHIKELGEDVPERVRIFLKNLDKD